VKKPAYDIRRLRTDIYVREYKARVRTGEIVPETKLSALSPDDLTRMAYRHMGRAFAEENKATDYLSLMEEWEWFCAGKHMYFPVPGLLEKILDAKMEVDPDSLMFPEHPFILAVPSEVGMRSVLVSRHSLDGRRTLATTFSEDIGIPVDLDIGIDGGWSLYLTELFEHKDTGAVEMLRFGCRKDHLTEVLNSNTAEQVMSLVGSLSEHDPDCLDLSSMEIDAQRKMLTIVCRLLVYMTTFPDAVRDGFPSREAEHLAGVRRKGRTLGERHFPKNGPKAHFRRWHFRSYPLRKDGSRKPGIVFVSESMVKGRGHVVLSDGNLE